MQMASLLHLLELIPQFLELICNTHVIEVDVLGSSIVLGQVIKDLEECGLRRQNMLLEGIVEWLQILWWVLEIAQNSRLDGSMLDHTIIHRNIRVHMDLVISGLIAQGLCIQDGSLDRL